jgi:hypothetical protein
MSSSVSRSQISASFDCKPAHQIDGSLDQLLCKRLAASAE